jgi:hypothetical protein
MEAIEQRTAVARDRELRLACIERALERAHVNVHMRFVQAQVVALRDDRLLAERAPSDVQRIGQAMPRALGVELGPEERDEPIARDRSARRRAENRQEREPASLVDLPGDRPVRICQRQAAQQLERNHHRAVGGRILREDTGGQSEDGARRS